MAIRCIAGNLGQGKTLTMVVDALARFRKERPQVYTNMTSLRFPEAVYIPGIDGLPTCENGLILLDEASTEMSSRFFHDQGRLVLAMLRQSRKNGLDLWYTAQSFDDVDKSLRDLTNEVVMCRRVGPHILKIVLKPGTKDVIGRSVGRVDPDVFPLYDTFEVIGRAGRGGVIGAAAERRAVGHRTPAAGGPPREARWRKVDLYRRVWWTSTYRLSPAAIEARDYLEKRIRLRRGVGWASDVRDELVRRNWLRLFGLTVDNVLPMTSFDMPWLPGFSPEEVQLRLAEDDQQAALDVAASAAKRARRLKIS